MFKNAKWLLAALVAVLLAAFFLCLAPRKTFLGPGQAFPEIRLKDLDGNAFFYTDTRGKVLLVNFWATWCGYCVEELPHLERLWQDYADAGLVVTAVLEDPNNIDLARDIRARNALTYPILLDERGGLMGRFNARGLPFSALVDRRGGIRFMHLGFNEKDMPAYEKEIRQLLAEK
ncbi:MAG: TlpA disulfide reductase family protein [Bacteroidota bacterium]